MAVVTDDPDVNLFHELTDMIGRTQNVLAHISEMRAETLSRLYQRPGATMSTVARMVELSPPRVQQLLKTRS